MIVTPVDPSKKTKEIRMKTKAEEKGPNAYKWWKANSKKDLGLELLRTASYLKEQQQTRFRQAALFARLYGNIPLFNFIGSSFSKMTMGTQLPVDRPTMNLVQSCIDTLVSRVTQSRPRPIFLTDNGDYKERNLAKKLNNFMAGELYQTKAYEMGEYILRDASIFGTGCLKVYEDDNKKVAIDRTLTPELLVDPNEARYGAPRQIYQLRLVDRDVLQAQFPKYDKEIGVAENAFPDNSAESSKSVSDQVMVVEGWHLPSSPTSNDGLHIISCSEGMIFEEKWTKRTFPFVFMHYETPVLGYWGQGLSEQLMGTQIEINKLLITITRSINLVGVPRVFVEMGSKVVKAQINNDVGAIVTYSGTKPQYEVAPCIAPEIYAQLQRLVDYGYQQSGISSLSAAALKPQGLNSGEAIRNYDDLQSDRFAALTRRYDNFYIDLSYQIIDRAVEIAKRDGEYQTIYPNKNGAKEIDLPNVKMLKDPFVIQCFDASSLPRDPAGRLEKVTEMAQSGMITMQEARRLLDYPDLEQVDKLATASEERILKILDEIVESGKYTPPDSFMDIQLALQLSTQYINLYSAANLEESKAKKLRNFFKQTNGLQQQAQAQLQAQAQQQQMAQAQMSPQAAPQGAPIPSPMGQ